MPQQTTKLLTTLFLISAFSPSTARAEEASQVLIVKKVGQPPEVTAEGVDKLGATSIYKMLGENFIVLAPNKAPQFGAMAPSVQPIKIPPRKPGMKPPVLPICSCPEDYRTAIEIRLKNFDMEAFYKSSNGSLIKYPNINEDFRAKDIPELKLGIEHVPGNLKFGSD